MPQFFVKARDIRDGRCEISGDDFHHLVRVRRVKLDDRILLRSDGGRALSARIIKIGESRIEAVVESERPAGVPSVKVTLCIGLLKGKSFDLAVRMATEVEVSRIVPVMTERSVPLPREGASGRSDRWQRIADEASKQSLRADIPAVEGIRSFTDLIADIESDVKILAHTGAPVAFRDFVPPDNIASAAVLVGPEGGFSPREVDAASAAGWIPLLFGTTHLRAETAAIVIPALVICLWER